MTCSSFCMVPEYHVSFRVGTRTSSGVDGVTTQGSIDPTWANPLLVKFRAGYPVTRRQVQGGSTVLAKNRLAAAIQLCLEYLLLQEKHFTRGYDGMISKE